MRKIFFVFFLVLCCSFLGCKGDVEKKDVRLVRETIQKYNKALAGGYSNMNMTQLKEATTKEHSMNVYYHMAALGEMGVRLEAELKKLEFGEITFSDRDHAVIKTEELWDYKHIGIKDMKIKREEKDLRYSLIYNLQRNNSSWVITDVASEKH